MKKKILSLVLVVAMLTSMLVLAPVAGATEAEATVEVSDVVGCAGDTVTVDVKVTSASKIFGGQFAFDYDASKLKLESIAWAVDVDAGNASNKDGNTFKEVTHAGPYDVFNPLWTTALDVSEGVVIAKMTFTILANTLGTAEVSVRKLQRADGYEITRIYTSGDAKHYITDVECVAGSVTVLPAGYSTESVLPPVTYVTSEMVWAFLFDLGVEFVGLNEEGTGWVILPVGKANWESLGLEGVVVFPETITDFEGTYIEPGESLPVVGIADDAFYDKDSQTGFSGVTAFVIPETVESIGTRAFMKSSAMDYYILNPNCTFGKGAICGTAIYSVKNSKWTTGPFIPHANGKAATIHGVAGGSVENFAADPMNYGEANFYKSNTNNPYKAFNWTTDTTLPTEKTLTFNGNTYYFATGATVTLPGIAVDGDQITVSWKFSTDSKDPYPAGSQFTITENVTLTAAETIQKPKTSSALGFKVTDSAATTAMRFTTDMAVADYKTLASLGEVTMGTIITPARYVSKAGALTKEALNDLSAANGGVKTYIDVATEGYFAIDDAKTTYTFAGSIKGFKSANVALDYAAAFYLTVEMAGGATFTVYSDFVLENNRNLTDAAAAVAAAGVGLTDAQKLFLEGLVEAIKNPKV